MSVEINKPLKLFYCYAREDKTFRDELDRHLSNFKRRYNIINWSDQEILPGTKWRKEIDAQLDTAHIILLLISAHFMASNYCYTVEMKRALERHEARSACVIPILLRRVDWKDAPFSVLQALPTDAKPIAQWHDPDEAYYDIVQGIEKAVQKLSPLLKTQEKWEKEGNALYQLEQNEEYLVVRNEAICVNSHKVQQAQKTTILTADDDPPLLRLVARNLQLEGYEVTTASDGKQALELIEAHAPDLVLLDVMMPKMDGFTVCHRVREFSAVPIIIMTHRGDDQDKVRGLDLGADDYLTKPFSVDELLARIRAVLRRSKFTTNEQAHTLPTTSIGDLTVDYVQHLVTIAGKKIVLTPTEYRTISYLAQNAGQVVTQNRLLEHVWGVEYVGEDHMLQVTINRASQN